MIASQLSGRCDVISSRLWRHQQNENVRLRHGDDMLRSSFLSSCRVRNKVMYVLSWRIASVLTRVSFWHFFPRCEATREINIKITFSWALKQFTTRVHTLFSILRWTLQKYPSPLTRCRNCHMINPSLVLLWKFLLPDVSCSYSTKAATCAEIEEYVHFTTQPFVEHNSEPEPATVL